MLTDSERKFLSYATPETGKFAIPLDAGMNEKETAAFESLLARDLIRLVDVCRIAAAPGIFRIFRLSQEARDMMEPHNA